MERFEFDPEDLDFDIFQLIERLENEHERMIVRIPKMKRKAPFIYEFTAIFSDYSLLEARMMMIPRFNFDEGIEAEIHVRGIYL
jgi:hypothetical protein